MRLPITIIAGTAKWPCLLLTKQKGRRSLADPLNIPRTRAYLRVRSKAEAQRSLHGAAIGGTSKADTIGGHAGLIDFKNAKRVEQVDGA